MPPSAKHKHKAKNRKRNQEDDSLHNYWKRKLPPKVYAAYDFRATLYRGDLGEREDQLPVGDLITAFSWDDATSTQTASITFENPDDDGELNIVEGNEVKMEWAEKGGNGWHDLWRLRATDVDADPQTGLITLTMSDELAWLGRSEDDFSYKKGEGTKKHKRKEGWYAHDITLDVCKRYGVAVGQLVEGQALIENLTETNTSPLKIIQKAWAQDREETGRRFVIRMENGKLSVTRLERSAVLLFLADIARGGNLTRRIKDDFATNLIVRAHGEKGEDKDIEVEVLADREIRKRYGIVRKIYEANDAIDTEEKAIERGELRLAEQQKPDREVSLSMPGIPTLRKGAAVQLRLPQLGLDELVYVKSVSHTVSGPAYDMDVTLTFTDPFIDEEGDKIRQKLCEQARKDNRKLPKHCGDDNYDSAAPKGLGGGSGRRGDKKQKQHENRKQNRGDHAPKGGGHNSGRRK